MMSETVYSNSISAKMKAISVEDTKQHSTEKCLSFTEHFYYRVKMISDGNRYNLKERRKEEFLHPVLGLIYIISVLIKLLLVILMHAQ